MRLLFKFKFFLFYRMCARCPYTRTIYSFLQINVYELRHFSEIYKVMMFYMYTFYMYSLSPNTNIATRTSESVFTRVFLCTYIWFALTLSVVQYQPPSMDVHAYQLLL